MSLFMFTNQVCPPFTTGKLTKTPLVSYSSKSFNAFRRYETNVVNQAPSAKIVEMNGTHPKQLKLYM